MDVWIKMAKKPNDMEKELSMIDDIDLDELIETTQLEILPDFAKEVIIKDDFKTVRKVIIESLPVFKEIDSEKFKGTIRVMKIIDNGVIYSLKADSIALRRSLFALDITMNQVKDKKDIDISRLIGKTVAIKRIQFTNKAGQTNQALQFFPLEK